MPAATAEKMVSAPAAGRVYLARRTDLELIKKRDTPIRDAQGEKVDMQLGERVKFRDGVLRVPVKGFVRGSRGESIKAAELIEFLEGNEEKAPHPLFGDREEGFWRHQEPAPAPSEDELDAVVQLAEAGDLAGLETFIEQEQAGWARPELLRVAESSRERVASRRAEAEPAAKAG